MADKTATALLDILDEEAEALKGADFDRVNHLAREKEQLIEGLAQSRMSQRLAIRIGKRAQRNAKLFEAAINGIKSAGKRLSEMRSVRDGMRVYGSEGEVQNVKTTAGKLERKA